MNVLHRWTILPVPENAKCRTCLRPIRPGPGKTCWVRLTGRRRRFQHLDCLTARVVDDHVITV